MWGAFLLHIIMMAVAQAANPGEGLLNKLLAPGPLISPHQALEQSRCTECHLPSRGVPDSKCLQCHTEIKADVVRKHGFHGLATKTCIQCHSDHKGRNFDSTQVDPQTFDHKLTGYPLEGKHKDIKCGDCHTMKRFQRDQSGKTNKIPRPNDPSYLGLKITCVTCHRKDDVHFFKGKWAKQDCNACHGTNSWRQDVRFDHARDAHFRLIGKHAVLACADCHVPKKQPGLARYVWKNLKRAQCLTCHGDQHRGKLGPKFSGGDCTKCHSPMSWKILLFDHDLTGYPLKGKHAELKCEDCHKQSVAMRPLKDFNFKGLGMKCSACHKDPHDFGGFKSARLGALNDCTKCHLEDTWKRTPDFDHNVNTRYPISGKHVGLDCNQCHVLSPRAKGRPARVYRWNALSTKTCEICHRSPHLKTFTPDLLRKKCTECHVDAGWKVFTVNGKRFDHSNTRFPLTGKHEEVACEQCHLVNKKEVFKFPGSKRGFCVDCHQNVHVGQFHRAFSDRACTECHDTASFTKLKPFNHEQTAFKLTGKHEQVECSKCHLPTTEPFPLLAGAKQADFKSRFIFHGKSGKKDDQFCAICHENPHVGQFSARFSSQACAECHTTQDFVKLHDFDHNETGYRLRGKHEGVACVKCHVPTAETYKVQPYHHKGKILFPELPAKDCAACHRDVHDGKFGNKCSDCHVDRGWREGSADFHKDFTLTGIHYSLACDECHKQGRRLSGLSQVCIACHQKDDIHNGTLPKCGTCHKQQFWENPDFKHSMTNFPLRGAHRTLDCAACHANGVYKGTPSACANCHLQQALAFPGNPNHQFLIGQNCFNCHNEFSFR